MRSKFIYSGLVLFFLCITNISCLKKDEIELINPRFEVLNDDLLISNPSYFLLSGDYLFLSDARSTDSLAQVFCSMTGERFGSLGKVGKGPEEFMSYQLMKGCNGAFIAHDINTLKTGVFQPSMVSVNDFIFTDITDKMLPDYYNMQILDGDNYLFLDPENSSYLFKQVDKKNNLVKSFGDFPVKEKDITFDDYQLQGNVDYDCYSGYLLFKFSSIPQLRLYKATADSFKLLAEKDLSKYEFLVKENKVSIDYLEPCRVKMASLTKDYVALLDDGNMTKEKRQSYKSPPISRRQIVLCDYKLRPKKILDLDMDIYVMASDTRTNDLYIIATNPDYSLIKINIENM